MKKLYLFLIFIVLFAETGYTKQRTASDALLLAHQHIQKSRSSKQGVTAIKLNLVYTATDTSLQADNGLFYVYNKGTNAGYVIISGDDRANTVLGYTDSGSFDMNKIPKGMKYWLNHFSKQIKYLINQPETQASRASRALNSTASVLDSGSVTVAPLLGETAWDQGTPYNDQCPLMPGTSTQCITGCVATAMAQVMYYYKWPVTGTGSNSYTTVTNKIPLSLNFSETQFDWSDMTPTYGYLSTAVQQNAVATLMYNCGVAVNMDYGTSESYSYATNMASALISNFGYDSNIQIYYRDFYSQSVWMNMIKTELNASRPVLYRGNSSDEGHIFVCDGYDFNNYFHFNWGWSGQDNGFYLLSALNPDYQDVVDYSDGYNDAEDIVIGVQKPSGSSVPSYQLCSYYTPVSNLSTISRTSGFGVSLKNVYNYGINQFTGSIGVALYSNDTLISLLKSNSISYAATYGTSKSSFSAVSIPTTVANRTYQLYFVYKAASQSAWQIMKGKIGTPNYLNVTVTSSQITFSNSTSASPNLALDTLTISGGLYQNQNGQFAINITNNGSTEYLSKIGINVSSQSNSTSQLFTQDADIQSGETKTYYMNNTITLNPGVYTVSALYDPQNNYTSDAALAVLGNSQIDTIKTVPSGVANLILTSPISMANVSAVQKDYILMNATIRNTGGYYNGYLKAIIYPAAGGSSLTYIGYQPAIFETNEQKTLTFGGSVNLPTDTQYLLEVWYQYSYDFWIPLTPAISSKLTFKLIDDFITPTVSTGIIPATVSDLNIYPNPAKDVIQFNSPDKVSSVKIYDLQGKLILFIQPLSSGIVTIDITDIEKGLYLIQTKTETGVKVGKFIKAS